MERNVDYQSLCQELFYLTEDVPYEVANLANASALLWQELPDINWVGFYRMEDGALVVGPFQGKPACIRIEVGRGVCGTAVAEDRVILVPDVHVFPGHIACDSASRSEIVLPIRLDGKIYGVLDIDSPYLERFTETDRIGLEQVVAVLEKALKNGKNSQYCPLTY